MAKFKSVDIPGLIKKSEKELAEAGLSENEIFGSPQFREYLQHLADGITAQFNKNKPYLELVSEDPKKTALTNGQYIRINRNSRIATRWSTTEAKFASYAGMAMHECAHINFLDFELDYKLMQKIKNGEFPVNVPEGAPQEFIEDFKGKYKPVFVKLFDTLSNLIEDCHDENRLMEETGDFVSTCINKIRASLHMGYRPIEDYAKANGGLTVGTILYAVAQLIRFGSILALEEESLEFLNPLIKQFVPLVDKAVKTDNTYERFQYITEMAMYFWQFMLVPKLPESSSSGNSQGNAQPGASSQKPQEPENPSDYLKRRPIPQAGDSGSDGEEVNPNNEIDDMLNAINALNQENAPKPQGRNNSSAVPKQAPPQKNGGSKNNPGNSSQGDNSQPGDGSTSDKTASNDGQGTDNSDGKAKDSSNTPDNSFKNGEGKDSTSADNHSSSGGNPEVKSSGDKAGDEKGNNSGGSDSSDVSSEEGDTHDGEHEREGADSPSSAAGEPSSEEEADGNSEKGERGGPSHKAGEDKDDGTDSASRGSETGGDMKASDKDTPEDSTMTSSEGESSDGESYDGETSQNDSENHLKDAQDGSGTSPNDAAGDDESCADTKGSANAGNEEGDHNEEPPESGASGTDSSTETGDGEKSKDSSTGSESDDSDSGLSDKSESRGFSKEGSNGFHGESEGPVQQASENHSENGTAGNPSNQDSAETGASNGSTNQSDAGNDQSGPLPMVTPDELQSLIDGLPDDLKTQLHNLMKDIIHQMAEDNIAEYARNDVLQEIKGCNFAETSHRGRTVEAVSHEPGPNAEAEYDAIYQEVGPYSKLLQRKINEALRELMEGGVAHHKHFGRIIEADNAFRPDQRFYANKKQPENLPEMAVSVLVDLSGSMHGKRIEYAQKAAILLQDFCAGLGIPCMVAGHNTGTRSVTGIHYEVFSDFHNVTRKNRLALAQMYPRSSNRDGMAIEVSSFLLKKRPERIKMLFVISDGQPNDTGYQGEAAMRDIQSIVKRYKKAGIETFAVAIGDDKEQIHAIYGDGFIDISELSKLPKVLTNVVKKRLIREAR